jgi:hypothetical protein
MTSLRLAIPACVALAMALSACSSGPTPAQKAADAAERAKVQEGAKAMAKAADGSAAVAVGDMMNDPEIRQQMGMSASGPLPPPPTSDVAAAAMKAHDVDPQQAQALAMCRILKSGRPRAVIQADISAATAELAGDPSALGRCHAAM